MPIKMLTETTLCHVRFGKRSGGDASPAVQPGYLVGDDYFLPVSSENNN